MNRSNSSGKSDAYEQLLRFHSPRTSEQPEWLNFVADSKLYDVAVVGFNYKSSNSIAKAMEDASRKGVGLICMKTQSPDYFATEHNIGSAPDHRKALSWVLAKGYVTAAIPGMTARDQVALNVQTMTLAA